MSAPTVQFRLFTKESLTKIQKRVDEEKEAKALLSKKNVPETGEDAIGGDAPTVDDEDEGHQPDPALEVGKKLPTKLGDFPPELFGKPIEELDEFYQDKYVCWIISVLV